MPDQETIDAEANQSDLAARVAELEAWKDLMIRNILGPAQFRPGLLRFGGNISQLDQNGVQVRSLSTDNVSLWFVHELISDPVTSLLTSTPFGYGGRVRGQVTGSTAQVFIDGFGPDTGTSLTVGQLYTYSAAGVAKAALALAQYGTSFFPEVVLQAADSATYATLTMSNTLFRIPSFTSDPGTLVNGDIWYNSTSNTLKVRSNGATVAIATGSTGMPMPPIVGTVSWNCLGAELAATKNSVTTNAASTAWPAANRAIYIPCKVTEDCTVTKLWVYNGATASGNINMCLYDSSFAQVANTEIGSTAQAGTNAVQEFDITNTALTAGLYYIACVFSSGTGTAWAFATAGDTPVEMLQSWGMAQEAIGSVDLPATATPAAVASAYIPFIGMSISPRTLVT